MRDLYIKNGQGFVVCYSLTNHQTFQDIKTMKDQIVRVKGSDKVPILLVANKVDLEHQREVPTVEGMVSFAETNRYSKEISFDTNLHSF